METGGYIYRFKSDLGEILYVGKTNNLQKRVERHLQSPALPDSFKDMAAKVEYIKFYSAPDLYIAENYYINKYKPEYNISNKLDGELTVELTHHPKWREYKNENLRPTVKNKPTGSVLRELESKLYILEREKEKNLKRALKAEEELKSVEDVYVRVMRKLFGVTEEDMVKKIETIIELKEDK